uniref:Putative ribonuclease H-like domain-containing protein n=1 Tax=Tanacetum cinerariifolium TaxID=118510 RepID=A0A699KM27_TANCI|nr:putative ribonuclease H-like domain-containing protein [Tanacetum cinerariifolium]
MDHKVKTIRSDNRTEFKNRIMNEFYEMKGIRKEFSVARTPQQNGTKANIDAGQAIKKTVHGPQYVLIPLLTFDSQSLKSLEDEVANDARNKSIEVPKKENGVQDPAKESDKNDQENDLRDQEEVLRKQCEQEIIRLFGQGEATNTNSTNRLNTVRSPVNAVSSSFTTIDPGRERVQKNEFESMFGQEKDANCNRIFTHVSIAGSTYVNLGGSIPVNAATLSNRIKKRIVVVKRLLRIVVI